MSGFAWIAGTIRVMRPWWALAVLLALPGGVWGQAQGVLHVKVTVADAEQAPTPVVRHALLVSDNPATSEPRRLVTGTDGTLQVRLRPGLYTIESDRPFAFLGKAYQWTEMVDVVAGADTTIELTAANAEIVPLTGMPAESVAAVGGRDPSRILAAWQESIVAVWSPTARASGAIVDGRGLIATDRHAVGTATAVEVQLSPELKIPATVLPVDVSRDVALLWVDASAIAGRPALALPCPPEAPASIEEGLTIAALGWPIRGTPDVEWGEVAGLRARAVDTDLRLGLGSAGGPVFNEAGALVGLSVLPADAEARERREVGFVRVPFLCEAVASARSRVSSLDAAPRARLPVEPRRAYPADALEAWAKSARASSPPQVASSSDFDVAFLTPPLLARAQQRADWTGGRSGRSPETEARIGRLTEFAGWGEYFSEAPAVLVVRVTPKFVEGFWKRLGREAARTQGAVLPAFKDFKSDFLRMRVTCGGADVVPIHPFVIEHRLSERDVVREGLYVFDPDALGPHCGTVTLSISSEQAPGRVDTLTLDARLVEQIWRDFEPYRAGGR
jgi:hypothetical protein